ncbi:bifunctional nuclease family protein [Paraoerskovia sediminicola]|uniref:bifunctional nuclease family protein n=1 Tax=Paraoerskovia sediminicola TaxID=1138587 RepID=UPI002572AA2B|nr:bifunctional nuclease family protein [Paraoerskovia sediminicola]
MSGDAPMVHVDVLGVRRGTTEHDLVVLLLDDASELVVPIVIGPREANAIATAQSGRTPPRPMTHDLLCDLLAASGSSIDHVEIIALDSGIYFAEIVLGNGRRVDSRASDAIAVAVRSGCTVLCSAEVVATSGVEVVSAAQRRDIEAFKLFLDGAGPEDFA